MANSLSLWEIDKNLMEALSAMTNSADENGVISDEAIAVYDEIEAQLERKQEAVLLFVKAQEAFADQIDNEIKRLQAMKKATQNANERLLNLIIHQFKRDGLKQFKTIKITANMRENEVVDVFNEDIVPKKFKRKKEEWKPDKATIKEALKAGQKIKGACLGKTYTISFK